MLDDIIHHQLILLDKIIVLTKMIILLISIILNKDDLPTHPTNPLAQLLFVRGEEQLSVGSPGFVAKS